MRLLNLVYCDLDIATEVSVYAVPVSLGLHAGRSSLQSVQGYTGSVGVHLFIQYLIDHLEDAL